MLTTLGVVFDLPRLPFYSKLMRQLSFFSLDFVRLMPLGWCRRPQPSSRLPCSRDGVPRRSCSRRPPSPPCSAFPINFHTSLLLKTLVPGGIIVTLTGLHWFYAARIERIRQNRRSSAVQRAQASRLAMFSEQGATIAFFILFLIYPGTSSAILSFFQCFNNILTVTVMLWVSSQRRHLSSPPVD